MPGIESPQIKVPKAPATSLHRTQTREKDSRPESQQVGRSLCLEIAYSYSTAIPNKHRNRSARMICIQQLRLRPDIQQESGYVRGGLEILVLRRE